MRDWYCGCGAWNGINLANCGRCERTRHEGECISTPPKKIEFETTYRGLTIALPDHPFQIGTILRVTVEEKRP